MQEIMLIGVQNIISSISLMKIEQEIFLLHVVLT
jgi:hypothetical protein